MLDIALAAQVIIWLVVLGVFLASGQASFFHPSTLYLLFHGIVFVARPLLVFGMGFHFVWDYMRFVPTEEDFVRTLAATSLGLIVFVGTTLWTGWTRTRFTPGPAQELTPRERQALFWTTVALLPLAAASIYATRQGVVGTRAANGIYIMTNSTGYLNDAQCVMVPMLCFWLVATRFHWLNLAPILAYVGYRSWFGWARWTILLFFLMLVLAYCWNQKKRWVPLWSFPAALPLLILFHLLGENRDWFKQYLTGKPAQQTSKVQPGMTAQERAAARYDTLDFANFDYLAPVVALVPKRTGTYNYGLQYLQLFTEPIPRILWRGKPVGAPVGLVNLAPYANWTGLTYTLIGDGWISGGWIGVVMLTAIVGAILGLGHRWFWTRQNQPLAALFYLSGLAMVPQWYRDGGIGIFKFLMFTWLPFLVWWALIWLLGHAQVPSRALLLQPGESLRLLRPNHGPAPSPPPTP